MNKEFPFLLEEGQIGTIYLKNRMVMAPMGNNFGSLHQSITEEQLDYYARQAGGGVGLIITESVPVDFKGIHGQKRLKIHFADSVAELKKLTDRVHKKNCRIVLQLTHAGRKASPEVIGEFPVSASSMVLLKKNYIPKQLTISEIDEIIEQFATAAKKAREANFDGIQILAASGHLVHQFLSKVSNQREDEYGGSIENRIRFLKKIIKKIKEVTGEKFPILVKLVGKDPEDPNGTRISVTEYLKFAEILIECGIASLHLSTNFSYKPESERNVLHNLAKRIKKIKNIPISMAGNILTPSIGEKLLKSGGVDFIELGRPLLADPFFCKKINSGLEEEIIPCLSCNHCREKTKRKKPIGCTVNPLLGLPTYYRSESGAKKHIVIIGGGPAGLYAAIRLSQLGHTGILYERNEALGGLLDSAATPPTKERIDLFRKYLIKHCETSGFGICSGKTVTSPKDIPDLNRADAVIIATGGKPRIPGFLKVNSEDVFLATEVLTKKLSFDGPIAILGGGQVGCETADYFSKKSVTNGCSVTLLSSSNVIGKNINDFERNALLKRLGEKGVKILVNAVPVSYSNSLLTYNHNGVQKSMEVKPVIIAKGWEPNHNLKYIIKDSYKGKVFIIGDAFEARTIMEALSEAEFVAREIDS